MKTKSLWGIIALAAIVIAATLPDPYTSYNSNLVVRTNLQVRATNFVNEEVITNGLTLGGIRHTSWPAQTNVSSANPTATIGATAVPGIAGTYMRSDAAPALPTNLEIVGSISGNNLVATNGITTVGLTNTGVTVHTPSTLQTLTVDSNILANATTVRVVGSGGAVTLISTPSIQTNNIADGAIITIRGTSDANTVTLQDYRTLTGSCIALETTSFTLANGGQIELRWSNGNQRWQAMGTSANGTQNHLFKTVTITNNTTSTVPLMINAAAGATADLLDLNAGGTNVTHIAYDGANTLALQNGTSAQRITLFDTYTDASNYRRAQLGWQENANALTLSTKTLGTAAGTGGSIRLAPLGTTAVTIITNGAVGIGTVNPAAKLDVFGGNSLIRPSTITAAGVIGECTTNLGSGTQKIYGVIGLAYGNTDATGDRAYGGFFKSTAQIRSSTEVGLHAEVTDSGGVAGEFYQSTNALMVITSAGSVGIGTASPGEKLEVTGNIKVSGSATAIQGGHTNVIAASGTPQTIFYVAVPNTNSLSGDIIWKLFATDGTDTQAQTGHTLFDSVAKTTTVTAGLTSITNAAVCSGGTTLSGGLTANVTTNNVLAIQATLTTSLTTTNMLIKWRIQTPSVYSVTALN